MSSHIIQFFNVKTKHPKLSQICNCGICSKGLMNEFETAVVNEPPVFEPLKFHCTCSFRSIFILLREYPISKRFVDTGANRKSGPEVIKLFSCSTQLSMKFDAAHKC